MGADHTIRFTDGEDYLAFERDVQLRRSGVLLVDIPTQELTIDPPSPIALDRGESVTFEAVLFDRDGEMLDLPIHWRVTEGEGTLSADTGSEVTFATEAGGVLVLEAQGGHAHRSILVDVPYAASGQVIDEHGQGIEDVTIAFGEAADSVVTDSEGYWSQEDLRGPVSVLPSKEGLEFYPSAISIRQPRQDLVFAERVPALHTVIQAGAVDFALRLVPAATFPTGTDDSGTASVDTQFFMAETPVTYELWREVQDWALQNGYTFANSGQGSGQRPVTHVSWRDSLVWTNALSERLGFDPVYTYQGRVLRDATDADACDQAVEENTDGFRLPTSSEWELAARYQGDDSSHRAISRDGAFWTPGSYASGATANVNDRAASPALLFK